VFCENNENITMSDLTFHKTERLKSRKVISSLFQRSAKNYSFNVYPVRFIWSSPEAVQSSKVQAGFSVSKKTFKRANQRNTVKRRMREAFRLHKSLLYSALEDNEKQYSLMFIFNGKEEIAYADIEKSFQIGIKKWIRALKEN
jgi:ribonuclease P protein component